MSVGDLINIVIADTPSAGVVVDAGGDLVAGVPDITAEAEAVAVATPFHDTEASITAGVPSLESEAVAVAGAPQVHDAEADLVAGAPSITAEAEAVPAAVPHDVAGELVAGVPRLEAEAVVVPKPSATNLQTCRMLSGAWQPRRARIAVMPLLATIEGPAEDLVRAIAREVCKQLPYYTYGEDCIPSDAAPTGTIGRNEGEHVIGGIVISLDPNQSEPTFGDGSAEPSVSEVRLLVTQGTSPDYFDLDILIQRRADLRRVLSRLNGGIGA